MYALQLASSANTSIGIGRSLDADIDSAISFILQLVSPAGNGRGFNADSINRIDQTDKLKREKTGEIIWLTLIFYIVFVVRYNTLWTKICME